MTSTRASDAFTVDLHQRVQLEAERQEVGHTAAFTSYMLEILTEAAEVDNRDWALYASRGLAASGYGYSDDASIIDVFVTDYEWSLDARTLGKADVDAIFKRVGSFVERCHANRLPDIEEGSRAAAMAEHLIELLPHAKRIRLVLLTNARVRHTGHKHNAIGGTPVTLHVWDIDRLFRLETSGQQREPITLDAIALTGEPLAALGPTGVPGDYEAYLLLIPGKTLAAIYAEHGARLLELNVRSFLQTRGNVNKGIQKTILEEPHRFLAYNNGISMTASSIELGLRSDGSKGIARIHDVQIVNGGQTTASLHYFQTHAKGQANPLDGIFVQAKLSVVPAEHLQELVPNISKYSNTQNVVRVPDFSANAPFHVALESLSRTIWAPAVDGTNHMTRWFYERARGQYADALARERTPARQRDFKIIHPLGQMFTKTDVAKFELTWSQRPELVSRGAEKCFAEFKLILDEQTEFVPDSKYFQTLVAKAILFRRAEKIIGQLGLGGYRAQTVTYSLALISHRTAQQLDLGHIWSSQELSSELAESIQDVAKLVHPTIVSSAGTQNISEWAKKPGCWAAVKEISWSPDGLRLSDRPDLGVSFEEKWSESSSAAATRVFQVNAGGWDALAQWGTRTKSLTAQQRKACVEQRKRTLRGDLMTPKQALELLEIIELAESVGFIEF